MTGAQMFLADIGRDRASTMFGRWRLSKRRNRHADGIVSERAGKDRPGMASRSATILRRMPSDEPGRDGILVAVEHETGGVSPEGFHDLLGVVPEGVRNPPLGSNAGSVRNRPEAKISDSPQLPRSTATGRARRIRFKA